MDSDCPELDSEISDVEYADDHYEDGIKMYKICVKSRPLVMLGTINIRAMLTILAKARLESISCDTDDCICPSQGPADQPKPPTTERETKPTSPNRETNKGNKLTINLPKTGQASQPISGRVLFKNQSKSALKNVTISIKGGKNFEINLINQLMSHSLGHRKEAEFEIPSFSPIKTGKGFIEVTVKADNWKGISKTHAITIAAPPPKCVTPPAPVQPATPSPVPSNVEEPNPIKIEFDDDEGEIGEEITAFVNFTNPLDVALTNLIGTVSGKVKQPSIILPCNGQP